MTPEHQPKPPRPGADSSESAALPLVAIVSNSKTPYRLHVHRRIAAEIPQIRLSSLFTHELSNAPWMLDAAPEIGPVSFGEGEVAGHARSPMRLAHEWAKGGRIVRWLEDHRAAAVAIAGYSDPACLRIIRWCRRRGVPSFLIADSNVRGDLAGGAKAVLKRGLVRRVVNSVTAVLPFGSFGRAYFARYGAEERRMFNFPLEPDYAQIERISAADVRAAEERFKLPAGRRRMIYSGRLAEVKRVDLLLDAFAAIAAQRPEWDLIIAGDGLLAAALRGRVPADLSPRVYWTGFIDDQGLLSALYRGCDVLVLPSDYEPWALVVNEAAAAGLAIVSSDVVGASAELVEDGLNGRIFPRGDGVALERALLEVTGAERVDEMKRASQRVLQAWRDRADPVEGFRAALRFAGVLLPDA